MFQFFFGDEHLAGFAAIEAAHDAGGFQLVDQTGGAGIADFEPPLQERN